MVYQNLLKKGKRIRVLNEHKRLNLLWDNKTAKSTINHKPFFNRGTIEYQDMINHAKFMLWFIISMFYCVLVLTLIDIIYFK